MKLKAFLFNYQMKEMTVKNIYYHMVYQTILNYMILKETLFIFQIQQNYLKYLLPHIKILFLNYQVEIDIIIF